MASAPARTTAASRAGLSAGILAAGIELFGLVTSWPWAVAVVVGGVGAAAAIAVRARSEGRQGNLATAIFLVVLGVLAFGAPDTEAAGLGGGIAVLALLLWLADEPGRVTGGMGRALPTIGLVALAFGVAWFSAFLLPTTRTPTGVVAGLLVVVILLAAILLARPKLLEREPSLTG